MKKKKRVTSLVDFTQPTVTVKLKFPFLSGARRVDEIVMRTACYCSDLEEMDEAEGDNEKMLRLIAALSDVDQNGKGIPFRAVEKYLRSKDVFRIVKYAGEILAGGADDEDEEEAPAEEGAQAKKVQSLRATGGISQA